MQILIDIADIHTYRERCQDWARRRLNHITTNAIIDPATLSLDREKTTDQLAEFDRQNPYPTILPTNV